MNIQNCLKYSAVSVNCRNCCFNKFPESRCFLAENRCNVFVNAQMRRYDKGDFLIKSNDYVSGIYCILDGVVKIINNRNSRKKFILCVVRGGDVIGLHSLINNECHSFSASAMGKVTACFIPASELQKIMEKDPGTFMGLTKNLCAKLDFIDQRITSISKKNIREQCAEMLLSVASKSDRGNKYGLYIDYSINDLASLVGTTKNYLYKILLDFSHKKILSFHNKKWMINDTDALSSIAVGGDKET